MENITRRFLGFTRPARPETTTLIQVRENQHDGSVTRSTDKSIRYTRELRRGTHTRDHESEAAIRKVARRFPEARWVFCEFTGLGKWYAYGKRQIADSGLIYNRALGTPLKWEDAKKNANHVRDWGIKVRITRTYFGRVTDKGCSNF